MSWVELNRILIILPLYLNVPSLYWKHIKRIAMISRALILRRIYLEGYKDGTKI
jgi:hypothetical protein